MEPKSPSKLKLSVSIFSQHKRFVKAGIVGVLIIILSVCGYLFSKRDNVGLVVVENEKSYYTVVVDCGSTGTRVNVYRWIRTRGLPILANSYPENSTENFSSRGSCKYHCLQTVPGLDKFVGNATGVRLSLEPLMLLVKKWVPRSRQRDTPIFVMCTAGVRRLREEDARRVLDDVERVVEEYGFAYHTSWNRVLSGGEEAYYGWLALNYKMGILGSGNSSKYRTLGLLDLGGSSFQVVMEVDSMAKDDVEVTKLKIGLVEHHVLGFSLPLFGLNEAFDRSVAMLGKMSPIRENSDERLGVTHPCLGSEFAQNYTCHACNSRLNTSSKWNLNTGSTETYLIGDPNWEHCKRIARAVASTNTSRLDWSQPSTGSSCDGSFSLHHGDKAINLTAAAYYTERFHALSGFFVVYNKLNLTQRANLTEIWEEGRQLCSKQWADNSRNMSYNEQDCFRVPYMTSLIENALCLGNKEIVFGPGDLSWTLGAALVEAEHLWSSTIGTNTLSLKAMEIIHSPIFVFLSLTCLLLIVYCWQAKLPMLGRKAYAVELSTRRKPSRN